MDSLFQTNTDIDEILIPPSVLCSPEDCHTHINTANHVTILTQNIRSVYQNLDAFMVTLTSLKFDCDILILTECHLSKSKPIPPLSNNYATHYTNNNLNQCDGVIFYVNKNLNYKIMEPCLANASCLVMTLNDLVVIGIYRTPSMKNIDNFLSSLQSLLHNYRSYNNIIITGDLNIDIKVNSCDSNSPNYLTTLAYYGILPAHRLPTRNNNCIDHMMLKSSNSAKSAILTNAPTDHSTVILSLMLKPERICTQKTKIIVDNHAVIEEIKTNIYDLLQLTDPNLAAETLVNRISGAINNNKTTHIIPHRKRCIQPWITPGILRCIRNRDKLHLKVKNNPFDIVLKITYARYRNFCQKLIRSLKINYERNKLEIAKNNPKKLWKSIKHICHIDKVKTNVNHNLASIKTSPLQSANYINNYFSTVGKNLAEKIDLTFHSPANFPSIGTPSLNSFVLLNTDPSELNLIISKLSNDSSPGLDNISTYFIKKAKNILIPVLCHIYNLCFEKGQFPICFKKAIVTPIHKGGSDDDVNNYRPISVLPVMAKILEKLINNRLKKFLFVNNLLSSQQFGFRDGISTEDAVLSLTGEITEHLDSGRKCLGVFLDLAKAFDSVSIRILLDKLYNIGIRGLPHQLLRDYLSDRQQQLKLGDLVLSDSTCLSYGVPQGSVLGPTLFLVYVNDLCKLNLPNCKIYTYADDTALIFHDQTWDKLRVTAEEGLFYVSHWLRSNLLSLNTTKTKFIPFAIRKNTLPNPSFGLKVHSCSAPNSTDCQCDNIGICDHVKYLGVIIDQHLKWNCHIRVIADRMRKLMWVFRRLKRVADDRVLTMTYKALAQSVLSYCIPAWGGAAKTHLLTLERGQRALLKATFSKPSRYPTFDLYSSYNLLTIRQLYILRAIQKIHLQLNYKKSSLNKRRIASACQVPFCNTKFKQNQFACQSALLYNRINNKLNIFPLTKIKATNILTKLLLSLNYYETEKLLERESF